MIHIIKMLIIPTFIFGSLISSARGHGSSTNENGTVKLKELQPGQSRQRVDGSVDKVHKDGAGYTHSYVDGGGNKHNESIRYDQNNHEVKTGEAIHPRNGGPAYVEQRSQPRQQQPQVQYRAPEVNRNGTIKLKELAPGESRVRADGTTDKVHRDGAGYTHSYVDGRGERHNESIRYDQRTGREVKMSDTEHRFNGDVVTHYRNGAYDVRGNDGLRSRRNSSGGYIYQERHDTWNNRPVIYREYNNNYKTVFVQNNYYGSSVYFYRPSYYGYSEYSRVLSPWSQPSYYTWDWNYNNRYSSYYRPYGRYASPSQWLTDYMIMSLIQSRYDRVTYDDDVVSYAQDSYGVSEAIREEIRMQVEQSLRAQRTSVQLDSGMDPQQIIVSGRLMVVHESILATDSYGSECQIDESDIVRIVSQDYQGQARLRVITAKTGSCGINSIITVSTDNLIQMENDFQSRIQLGMGEMRRRNVGQ